MKKIVKKIFFIVFFFLSVPLLSNPIQAGFFSFDKNTVTVANGATFEIAVIVNPGSDSLNGAETYISYDPNLLKVNSVSAGTLFPFSYNDTSVSGKIYVVANTDAPGSSVSSAGTIATITFQALKDGSGTLSYDCDTSKILKDDINVTNVVTCSQNTGSAVTIGGGQTTAPTNAPDQLPQSGVFDNVAKIAVPGMLLLFIGGIFRLLL
ncbi:MAG: cohesin domain-containing protein [Patescibacteria group bacterium]|jgi:hypothetical protein